MAQAAPIITAGSALIGAFTSAKQAAAANEARNNAATAAEKGQAIANEAAQNQLDFAKLMQEFATKQIDMGYGDPQHTLRATKDALNLDRQDAEGSAAAALKAAGAKPGDSALGETVGNVHNAYSQQWAQLFNQISQNAPMQGLALLQASQPGNFAQAGNTALGAGQLGLNGGLAVAGSTPQLDPSGFLTSLIPYISKWTGGSTQAPTTWRSDPSILTQNRA